METFIQNLREELQTVREQSFQHSDGRCYTKFQWDCSRRPQKIFGEYIVPDVLSYEQQFRTALEDTLEQGREQLDWMKLDVGAFVVPTLIEEEGEDVEDAYSKVMNYLESFIIFLSDPNALYFSEDDGDGNESGYDGFCLRNDCCCAVSSEECDRREALK